MPVKFHLNLYTHRSVFECSHISFVQKIFGLVIKMTEYDLYKKFAYDKAVQQCTRLVKAIEATHPETTEILGSESQSPFCMYLMDLENSCWKIRKPKDNDLKRLTTIRAELYQRAFGTRLSNSIRVD